MYLVVIQGNTLVKRHDKRLGLNNLISILLVLTLTSCGLDIPYEDKMSDIEMPDHIMLKWKIKKVDYIYDYWDTYTEERCGWYFIGDKCYFTCEERPKNDYRNDLFPTETDCLHSINQN